MLLKEGADILRWKSLEEEVGMPCLVRTACGRASFHRMRRVVVQQEAWYLRFQRRLLKEQMPIVPY
jgi:hypothetical protein